MNQEILYLVLINIIRINMAILLVQYIKNNMQKSKQNILIFILCPCLLVNARRVDKVCIVMVEMENNIKSTHNNFFNMF